ncbi:ChaB family protein [Acrocarpospora pleiomorpha]
MSVRNVRREREMPAQREMPDTLRRSPKRAQETWAKAHDAAVQEYGEGERAHRTAYAALKRTWEKIGDHWEAKSKRGPSDERAASKRRGAGRTEEGVNAKASKQHLYDVAKRMDIAGRSSMTKEQLVDAIRKANRRAARTRA